MPIEPDKLDAALELIDWAARLFTDHGAYRAATTLAGAAEHMLGNTVPGVSAFETLRDNLATLSGEPPDAIGKRLNRPRNWLKHGNDAPDQFDWPNFAATEIMRAATNLRRLGHQLPASVDGVIAWVAINCPDD